MGIASGGPEAGAEPPEGLTMDGVDLIPYIVEKKEGPPHNTLCWKHGKDWAIRQGDWKLVHTRDIETPQLFNLAQDQTESRDLVSVQPDRARALQAAFDAWNKELPPHLWWPVHELKRVGE